MKKPKKSEYVDVPIRLNQDAYGRLAAVSALSGASVIVVCNVLLALAILAQPQTKK